MSEPNDQPQQSNREPRKRKAKKRNRGGAPDGDQKALGNPDGQCPTHYKSSYAPIAERMCAQGATCADLADRFGVSTNVIVSWQDEQVEFSVACNRGRKTADDRVERSLYERACGYTYESEKLFCYDGEVIRARVKVHVPPDVRAAVFWLLNRCPDRWKDSKHIEPPQAEVDPHEQLGLQLINALRPKPQPEIEDERYEEIEAPRLEKPRALRPREDGEEA